MLFDLPFHFLDLFFAHIWDILHLCDAQRLALGITPHFESGCDLRLVKQRKSGKLDVYCPANLLSLPEIYVSLRQIDGQSGTHVI
jgi:hypothetical protein